MTNGSSMVRDPVHALLGPGAALTFALALHAWLLTAMYTVGAVIGWAGWWRDYRLAWRAS